MAKSIRVAVVGTGFGTSVQVPGFQAHPDTEVVAIVSGRESRAREAAEKFGIPHAFTDYRDALQLPELDVVSIVTPPYLHHQMTLDSFAAGKHVLCEKPMAMNLAEANSMADAWRASGKTGMIDHEFRYVPARHYFHDLVKDGYLGKLLFAQVSSFTHILGAKGGRPHGWLFEAETGGGFLGALGSHSIDSIRWWFGEIARVTGWTETVVKERKDPASGAMKPVTADDSYGFMCELAGGARVSVVSYMTAGAGAGNRFEAWGTDGWLVIDNANKLWGAQNGEALQEIPIPAEYTRADLGVQDARVMPFVKLVERFVEGMRTGTSPDPSFDDGVAVQKVMDAVRESNKTGEWVSVR
jgi:predicted dehydrogenase